MNEKKQARLVERGRNELNGGTYETRDMGNGHGFYADLYFAWGKTKDYKR
jgi:hypothetical protein